MFALEQLFFDKNEISKKKKNCQNPLRAQFQISEAYDFHKTPQVYVFWRADYEYNSGNCRIVDFHGETLKNQYKSWCLRLYLNQYAKFRKMFNRGWFELRKTPYRVPICLIPFNRDYLNGEKLPIMRTYIWFHSMGIFKIEKFPIVCLSVWFNSMEII